MHDRRSNRAARWCPLASVLVMSAAAATLYAAGYSAIIENYDGIVSVFNVMTIGSWCCATILLLAMLPIASLIHEALHDR
jgi:hypothetical protein